MDYIEQDNEELKEVNLNIFYTFTNLLPAVIVAWVCALLFAWSEILCCIVACISFLVSYHFFIFETYKSEYNRVYDISKTKVIQQQKYTTETKKLLSDKIKDTMNYSALLSADINTINYENAKLYLENKKRPALKEALRIAELRKQTKEYIAQYKLMKYEYDYLFALFPELENYIEIKNKNETIQEIKDNYDYVRSWISKEEYEKLGENDRNQLALERYINSRKKHKWQIGRDYEMYIGHKYENKGYKVQYTGIVKRLEDMGRDLIATKGKTTLIIQCKYWSQNKIIHENHICQLFGTTIQYNIENNCKAKPVFITSTQLSDTALKFANYLNIEVVQNEEFKEFPRIKCNIGKNNEKIYHLPFDQQYDRTVIGDKEGEFFAWNTTEAVLKGFRRAKKYFYQ